MVGLSAQRAEVSVYATTPISSGIRRPRRSERGPCHYLADCESQQAGGNGQLGHRRGAVKLGGQGREDRQVEVHGDRAEDCQQAEHHRQRAAHSQFTGGYRGFDGGHAGSVRWFWQGLHSIQPGSARPNEGPA